MSETGQLEKFKQQWKDMDPKFKWAMGAAVVGCVIVMMVKHKEREQYHLEDEARKAAVAQQVGARNGQTLPNSANNFSALPSSNRNQGLEDLLASLDKARKQEIFPYLEKLVAAAKVPILYISHLPEEIERLAQTVVTLDQGRVKSVGSKIG